MMKGKYISITLFSLYLLTVALLCFMHGEQLPDLPKTWFGIASDKVVHMLMFLPFPMLSYQVFHPHKGGSARRYATLVLLTAIGAGVASATEKLQGLLDYRAEDKLDMMADFIGLSAGALICGAYIFILSMRRK